MTFFTNKFNSKRNFKIIFPADEYVSLLPGLRVVQGKKPKRSVAESAN